MAKKFVQIIQFETDSIDETLKLDEEWLKATEGKRLAGHTMTCADRDNKGRYYVIVEFPSYEDAQKNNELPETQDMSAKMMKVTKGEPTFYNLDVIDEND